MRGRSRLDGDAVRSPRRYIAGHADTGKRLRLTETATEVVETDPATFAFTVVHSSVAPPRGNRPAPIGQPRRP